MRLGALEAAELRWFAPSATSGAICRSARAFPTLSPAETIGNLIDFFTKQEIEALGIGSFGPLSLDPNAPDLWRDYHHAQARLAGLSAAHRPYAEAAGRAGGHRHRRQRRCAGRGGLWARAGDWTASSTTPWAPGVGGGAAAGRQAAARSGASGDGPHAAASGSAAIPRRMASVPSTTAVWRAWPAARPCEKRWGVPGPGTAAGRHVAWEIEAEYLAQMCVNTIVTLSPERDRAAAAA